jgi:hypothetical protein
MTTEYGVSTEHIIIAEFGTITEREKMKSYGINTDNELPIG